MTLLLLAVLLIQLACIFFLRHRILTERNTFRDKLKPLEEFMAELHKEQLRQSIQLQLSDELKIKLKEANAALSHNIFDLNHQLFKDLYPKKEI